MLTEVILSKLNFYISNTYNDGIQCHALITISAKGGTTALKKSVRYWLLRPGISYAALLVYAPVFRLLMTHAYHCRV